MLKNMRDFIAFRVFLYPGRKVATSDTRSFKLPFVGHYSKIAKLKLRQLTKRFCKSDLTIKFQKSCLFPTVFIILATIATLKEYLCKKQAEITK